MDSIVDIHWGEICHDGIAESDKEYYNRVEDEGTDAGGFFMK